MKLKLLYAALFIFSCKTLTAQTPDISLIMSKKVIKTMFEVPIVCDSFNVAELSDPEQRVQFKVMDTVLDANIFGLNLGYELDTCKANVIPLPLSRKYKKKKLKRISVDYSEPYIVYKLKSEGQVNGLVFVQETYLNIPFWIKKMGACFFIFYRQMPNSNFIKIYAGTVYYN